jgi:subfamily B ATP-binding cassette protein MsbA
MEQPAWQPPQWRAAKFCRHLRRQSRPTRVRSLRLLSYVLPYWWQFLASVALMALVGLLDAGRVLLIGPIFDRVLNPGSQGKTIQLFRMPGTGRFLDLEQLIPSHFQNPWTMVAFALVAATVLKGIFDYAGTYLVNYAGFGMITDLRDNLYNAILRSSAAFFTKHTTGTLLSTIVNDIEKVQFAMSSVLAEFLQQFFTFVFTAAVVILLGGKLAWVLLLFVPVILYSSRKIGRQVRSKTRGGQDKLAEIQNILHETITGQPHRQSVRHGELGDGALPRRRATAVPRESPAGGGIRDQLSVDGRSRLELPLRSCC